MQGFQYLLLHLCLGLVWLCEGKSISQVTQQEDKAWRLADDRVEQDDLESLLEPVKEDFLKMLNFSGVPVEERKVQPPPFMMELYNKYASDMPSVPRSDVIRSFVIQEVTQSVISENKSSHRLLFNVSVPSYEEVIVVQLRLFMLRQRSHSVCDNTSTSISIYNVVHTKAKEILRHVDRKDISDTERSDTWEAFDVTSALQSWLQSKHGAGVLEVEVQNGGCGSSQGGSYEISLNSEDSTSPVLIVFSNDLENRKRKVKTELQNMMTHEEETFLLSKDPVEDYNSEVHLDQHRRRKRNARKNYCRRESLKVNFKDIGWDKWIVAPPEYDAYECKGVCSFPLTDDVTPSKHAIIQTLVNLSNPKKAHRACCVPTKLDPLTVMYQENGIITVRHLYEEMKVAKCGCR